MPATLSWASPGKWGAFWGVGSGIRVTRNWAARHPGRRRSHEPSVLRGSGWRPMHLHPLWSCVFSLHHWWQWRIAWWRIRQPMQETRVQSLVQEDPLEKEMATHSDILAWSIPRTEEPGSLQSMGLQRVRHSLVTEQQHVSAGLRGVAETLCARGHSSTHQAACYLPRGWVTRDLRTLFKRCLCGTLEIN